MTTMARPDATIPTALRELRRWHLGTGVAAPLPPGSLPALLAPFRDPTRVRQEYPLVLTAAAEGLSVRPFGEVLPTWLQRATAQARVLQDNLQRLERRVRLLLVERPDGEPIALLREAGQQMIAELQLRDSVAAGVRSDFASMLEGLPALELLPLNATTPMRLLLAVSRRQVRDARAKFASRANQLAGQLRGLLQIEAQKDPAARGADAVQKSLGGGAARFFDSAKLARNVGDHRGSMRADPERRQRLQQALSTIAAYLAAEPMPEFELVHTGEVPAVAGVSLQPCDEACAGAAARFDHFAAALLPVVRSLQLAELERRGGYEPERHDAMLAAMTWRDLAPDELHVLPVVAALAPARALAGHAMQSLTRLLTSGRPVQVLALVTPSCDPLDEDPRSGDGGPGEGAPSTNRLELGYLGVAFREAYVQQTTAARPTHLLQGFEVALRGTRPGLHVVDSGLDRNGQEPPLGAFLHAGAAIEGRAHPLFHYDPEAGETWAKRLDFTSNPDPESDWPTSEVTGPGEPAGARRRLAFTYADYALLEPHLHGDFSLLPVGLASDELVELADYLQLDADAARRRVPFVWALVGMTPGSMQRVAVRRNLVDACRDRLRFWHLLQELAGVRNDYVREAVQRARQEGAEQAAREREALQARHEQELAEVRAEASGAAMQGLARMLLELDPLAGAPVVSTVASTGALSVASPQATPVASAPATAPPTAPPTAPAPAAAQPATTVDEDMVADPWIESARCSTCNDCVNMNPLLFVYNENKQARIGNPKAGSFAQLVRAAEKCPSRCIHPGKPQDSAEPGLEALVARAAPFNL
jgi:ferredoxin